VVVRKKSRLIDNAKAGRTDRRPTGAREGVERSEKSSAKNRSWEVGDKGQGREGLSKGYGGSGGGGTGPSGPEKK
jgi:hypothetical protein